MRDLHAEYLFAPQSDDDWVTIDEQEIDVTPEGLPLAKMHLDSAHALPGQVCVNLQRSHNVTFINAETQPENQTLRALEEQDVPAFLTTYFPQSSQALRDVLSGHFHQGSFPYATGYNSQLAISHFLDIPGVRKVIDRYAPDVQGGHFYFAESKRHIFVTQNAQSPDTLNVIEVYIQTPQLFNGDESISIDDASVVLLSTGTLSTKDTEDGQAFFKSNDSLIIDKHARIIRRGYG